MKVSIIIPALDEAENIEACLASVKRQQGDFEIIVVDGGSRDRTVEIARHCAQTITSERGRGRQMNAGASLAKGEALLFLHSDSQLHPEALAGLRRTLADNAIVGGTFTLKFDSDRLLLKVYAFFTRFKPRAFHYGDQGIFVRRSAYDHLQGFKQTPLMEDVDFLKRLRKLGKTALIKLPVTTSARRFLKHGPVRQQLRNLLIVSLYSLGVKPETLARWYRANRDQERKAGASFTRSS